MPRPTFRGFRGGLLRELREERGWTQEKLAVLVGVDPSMVTRWENRHIVPEVSTIVRIAAALQVRPQEFTDVPVQDGSLVDLRLWAGLTRQQAAGQTGISERRLTAFEHLTTRPDAVAAAALAHAYAVTADTVLEAWDRDRAATYPETVGAPPP